MDAIAAGEYERAHDFAWRLVQVSPRRDRDPAALSLLARAQSLSGRGYDALVMLQRLADMGVVIEDAESSDDFRRVRDYPQWPQLLAAMSRVRSTSSRTADKPAAAAASPPVAAREAAAAVAAAPPVAAPGSRPGETVLRLPESVSAPVALAYDVVSARFVLARANSDVLSVLSETSGNATNLVSAGWSGGATITAVAIDRARGDLWVAGNTAAGGVLYHLQLISGRLLQKISAPKDSGASRFVALAMGGSVVYVLDAEGHRVLSLQPRAQALRVDSKLPADLELIGLVHTGGAMYVSHAAGLLRLDGPSRAQRRIAPSAKIDASHLHSLAWHNGALFAIRRNGEPALVRVRLNPQGTTIAALDVLAPVATVAGALSADAYYYLGRTSETDPALHKLPLGK